MTAKRGKIEADLNYMQYYNARKLLDDSFIRFAADSTTNEILSCIVDIEDEKLRFVRTMARKILDQLWIAGVVVILFNNNKRKRKREKQPPDVSIADDGMGQWVKLKIITNKLKNQRKYEVWMDVDGGKSVKISKERYRVFEWEEREPRSDGSLRSALNGLIDIHEQHVESMTHTRHAVGNMAHPAIVTESSDGSFMGLSHKDFVGTLAGEDDHRRQQLETAGKKASDYRFALDGVEVKRMFDHQREMHGGYMDEWSDAWSSKDPLRDQTFGALRPLPGGHKVAHHLAAQMRSDVEREQRTYEQQVVAAFGIDSNTLLTGGGGSVGVRSGMQAVERAEKFMIHAINRGREKLEEIFTVLDWEVFQFDKMKKTKLNELDSAIFDPKKKVTFQRSPPIKFGELIDVAKTGLTTPELFKELAEGILGQKLTGKMRDPAELDGGTKPEAAKKPAAAKKKT